MPSQILRNDSGYIMQWPGSHVLLDSYSARYQWAPAAQPLIRAGKPMCGIPTCKAMP